MALPREPKQEEFPELYERWQKEKDNLTPFEKACQERGKQFYESGFAYYQLHSTKPQTIGSAIASSPVALLAWIYEKLHDWSDHKHYKWTEDEILTWISIYYFSTPGPAATQRIYYEEQHASTSAFMAGGAYIDVPLGIAHFPKELGGRPKLWHQTMGPVVHESFWDYGGHFAAYERPDAIVQDLREMMGREGKAKEGKGAYGVCGAGRLGYEDE